MTLLDRPFHVAVRAYRIVVGVRAVVFRLQFPLGESEVGGNKPAPMRKGPLNLIAAQLGIRGEPQHLGLLFFQVSDIDAGKITENLHSRIMPRLCVAGNPA